MFDDYSKIEIGNSKIQRTKVFYCNPSASYQKPFVENVNKDAITTTTTRFIIIFFRKNN